MEKPQYSKLKNRVNKINLLEKLLKILLYINSFISLLLVGLYYFNVIKLIVLFLVLFGEFILGLCIIAILEVVGIEKAICKIQFRDFLKKNGFDICK